MCYGFPRGEDCPELLAADMPPDDDYIPASPPRVGRLGSGFWVACKAHQLQDELVRLQNERGDDPRAWGRPAVN